MNEVQKASIIGFINESLVPCLVPNPDTYKSDIEINADEIDALYMSEVREKIHAGMVISIKPTTMFGHYMVVVKTPDGFVKPIEWTDEK